MRTYRLSRTAGKALEGIADYIGRESQDLERGATFVARLRARCEKLATLPGQIGRSRLDLGPDVRSFIDGNYVIIFRYGDTFIDILNIVHVRRDRQPST